MTQEVSTRVNGMQDKVLSSLSEIGKGTVHDLEKLPGLANAGIGRIGQALDRLKKKGQVAYTRKGQVFTWYVKKDNQKTEKKSAKVEPMSDQMVRRLNLRIHQADRALSFEIEGWQIKVGFEK